MQIPDYLLECLHDKKVAMGAEVKSFQDDMKAYLIIYPIEEKKNKHIKQTYFLLSPMKFVILSIRPYIQMKIGVMIMIVF